MGALFSRYQGKRSASIVGGGAIAAAQGMGEFPKEWIRKMETLRKVNVADSLMRLGLNQAFKM